MMTLTSNYSMISREIVFIVSFVAGPDHRLAGGWNKTSWQGTNSFVPLLHNQSSTVIGQHRWPEGSDWLTVPASCCCKSWLDCCEVQMFPLTGGICWTQPALSWSILTLERSGEERAGPGELQVIVDLYKDRGGNILMNSTGAIATVLSQPQRALGTHILP